MNRIILLLSLITLSVFNLNAENRDKKLNSKIEKVTVFINGAQITRSANATIVKGNTILKFTAITPNLDPNSVQVTGEGDFTILSIRHQMNYLVESPRPEEVENLQKQIRELEDKINLENSLLSVFNEEEALLSANRSIGGTDSGVNVEDLMKALEYYRNRLTDIKTKRFELNQKIRKFNEDLQILRLQLSALSNQNKRTPTSEIWVTVSTKKTSVNAKFFIKYIVNGAGWHPSYDIRVKDIDNPVNVTYKANIYQSTGEDWNKVDLTVSSGNPQLGGVKPVLNPWYLGFNQQVYKNLNTNQWQANRIQSIRQVSGRILDVQTGEPLPGATIQVSGTSIGTSSDMNGNYSIVIPLNAQSIQANYIGYNQQTLNINNTQMDFYLASAVNGLDEVVILSDVYQNEPMREMSSQVAVARKGKTAYSPPPVQTVIKATNFQFEIDMPYTIPSNGKTYTVEMNQYDLDAIYEYQCTPKLDEGAFLTARVTGWESFNFLQGEASIFFEGTYITKSILDVDNVNDTLPISLGRDENIVIKRVRQGSFQKNQFMGGNKVKTIGWEISVRNKKQQTVHIVIDDQFPVSTDKEIVVSLKEKTDASVDEKTGKLKWDLQIPSNETKKLMFVYEVKYPKNKTLILE
jgi:Domain of unknown function (DUF4139)/N-terminal domain of unknown function (DUF4140)